MRHNPFSDDMGMVWVGLWATIAILSLVFLFWVGDAGGHGHPPGFCGTTSKSLTLARAASSEVGTHDPYIQMLYSAYVGLCERVRQDEITTAMARLSMNGLERLLEVLMFSPHETDKLLDVLAEINVRAKLEAEKQVAEVAP
tara:strand:+ start:3749 stop:4174 length:426 start_codon:yes stop_codon:yes gene_type:complete